MDLDPEEVSIIERLRMVRTAHNTAISQAVDLVKEHLMTAEGGYKIPEVEKLVEDLLKLIK
jgi:hypothetical protein